MTQHISRAIPEVRIRRKLERLVLLGLFACASLAVPEVADAQGGPCVDHPPIVILSGARKDPGGGSSSWVTAVKSSIYIPSSAHFYACTLNALGNDGSLNWVAFTPGSTNSEYESSAAIVQIGVTRCTYALYAACSSSVPHFFWARGGCGIFAPVPWDLGTTSWQGTHLYSIVTLNNSWRLEIDGEFKASISKTDNGINCWSTQDTKADWLAERWDRGDSTGSNGATSQRSQFTSLRYAVQASNLWVSPTLTSCYNSKTTGAGRFVCSYGSDLVHVWSLNP